MTTEVFATCPDCADPGPHRMWRDSTGETVIECHGCSELWSPVGVL